MKMRMTRMILSVSLLAGCTADIKGLVNAQPGSTTSTGASASTSVNASLTLPNPLDIASAVGFTADSCSAEGRLKSGSGASTSITFKNSSQGKIRIFWLDSNGKRVEYNKSGHQANGDGGLEAGASFTQQTFVSHPWLITNEQGQCQGIYTANAASPATLEIKKTLLISSSAEGSSSGSTSGSTSGSASASGSLTLDNASEARVRQGIDCLKAKGKSAEALAANGSLNLYLEANQKGGIFALSAQAYLKQAVDIIAQAGC